MGMLQSLLETQGLSPTLPQDAEEDLAHILGEALRMHVYPRSIVASRGVVFFLGRQEQTKWLGLLYRDGSTDAARFSGQEQGVELEQLLILRLCPADHANAVALRRTLPFTAPQVVGGRKSFGFGDRLGLATPGHVRAVRKAPHIVPVFAQQSIREMERSGRTPEQVLDDATWGVFQEGWRDGFGADADHLKTTADVDVCVEAGYTMYTVDPGDHVDNEAVRASLGTLKRKAETLPWDVLESSPQDLYAAYLDRTFDLGGGLVVRFSEETLLRAAVKYGRAVVHSTALYRHLAGRMGAGQDFELEVSVDETETPTTPEEHFFVASELKRLGVRWVSLAPRFVGRFEKGVDYIGDLKQFETEFAKHVTIARAMGPYKLSVHSGSDKFSIYPIVARLGGDLIHVKTAGTSYLEALRALTGIDPDLFRDILAFARSRYQADRATYHVSADLAKVPWPDQLSDAALIGVLDTFDGRQVLHVTFGSVMTGKNEQGDYRFRQRLLDALRANEEVYYAALEKHLGRHLAPFVDEKG
ncbi:MAG: tagaturonate epimerase family protein [Anaerolineae bacterium]|jgi:hypothetical protein|nr:tagaturonate epimerase family protein [Anaerolineae bacterium]MDH7472682.1 tagaturonate epimerase family protein [Anaerolineae bacterium]